MVHVEAAVVDVDEPGRREAMQWAGAFVAGFQSEQTRRSYRGDVGCSTLPTWPSRACSLTTRKTSTAEYSSISS